MDAKEVKELQQLRNELQSINDRLLNLINNNQDIKENQEKLQKAPNAKQLFDPELQKEETTIPPATTPTLTLIDVKRVLMEKAHAGFDQEVHALIKSYDVEKLSSVPKDKYAELLEKAKEIGNG
ncbi:hypothetical protein [Butyrivibrio sp. MB2005]|uniref:hypothetical protein n=1 Tax=Butyrivibrio sp. MB2005 TaxID=1280678 RepID=UPI0003F56864|nr:hypothetical protein [Butyrivibrio sp. MB2005]